MSESSALRYLKPIVFVTGFCLMAVQLISGRVLAPYLGVSIYTWTSVIAGTLLGIALGNQVGGKLADERLSPSLYGLTLAAGGLATIVSIYISFIIGTQLELANLPILMKTTVFTLATFFPPAFCLAMATPMAMRFAMKDLATDGRTYGSIGAWSAAGNILGIFLTGFVLISVLGTRLYLLLIAAILFALGIWVAAPEKIWKSRVGLLAAILFIGALILPNLCERESNYYCFRLKTEQIQVNGQTLDQLTIRLDHLVHSYVVPAEPRRLGYGYEQLYANLVGYRFKQDEPFSSLFIGGGGYVMPRYLEAEYSKSQVTVAEIDPTVTLYNHERMGLSATTSIESINLDARIALRTMPADRKFDLVFGDAFNDFGVPFHLTTVEFQRLLKQHMTEHGVYALNIIDDPRYGQFLASMVRTMQAVWKHVYVAPLAHELKPDRNTIVLIASDDPIDEATWKNTQVPANPESYSRGNDRLDALSFIPENEVEAFLTGHPVPILEDAYVPLDRYLAPVFRDAY